MRLLRPLALALAFVACGTRAALPSPGESTVPVMGDGGPMVGDVSIKEDPGPPAPSAPAAPEGA